jgi:hypothetical protein
MAEASALRTAHLAPIEAGLPGCAPRRAARPSSRRPAQAAAAAREDLVAAFRSNHGAIQELYPCSKALRDRFFLDFARAVEPPTRSTRRRRLNHSPPAQRPGCKPAAPGRKLEKVRVAALHPRRSLRARCGAALHVADPIPSRRVTALHITAEPDAACYGAVRRCCRSVTCAVLRRTSVISSVIGGAALQPRSPMVIRPLQHCTSFLTDPAHLHA